MPSVTRPIRLLPCLAFALVLSVIGAWQSTSCHAGDGTAVGGTVTAPAPDVVGDEPAVPHQSPHFETVPNRALSGRPITAPPAAVRVDWAVAPPPGTLGRTYKQPSALIPKDEHPRTAMIEIDSAALPYVEVIGLEDFDGFHGRDGLWHFKSKRPLLPGVPHIYQVIAHDGTPGGAEDVRTVRMIPGRIVRLTF